MKTFLLILWVSLFLCYIRKLISARKQSDKRLKEERDRFYHIIRQTLGENAVESVKDHSIWKGMPECLIPFVFFGIPDDVTETRTPGNIYKVYYYEPIANARKNARKKYNVEIHVENKEVTYWEIMN